MSNITKIISHFAGKIAYCHLPAPLAALSVKAFAKLYRINPEEAAKPISEYKTVGDFFIRDLKAGLRPIQDGIVSPVDGKLRNWGEISNNCIEQVKGRTYTVSEFLQKPEYSERFQNGYFFNCYLAPYNYHHIHAPLAGDVVDIIHVPGSFLPVNDWALNRYDKLFTQNERKIVILNTQYGLAAVVLVAALNVGDIRLTKSDIGAHFEKGEKLGTFRLGSTVVLLFEKKFFEPLKLVPESPLFYGQTLAVF